MAAVVYLKRRRDIGLEPVSSTDSVPIRRAEWLAIIARDPTLVLRPEVECGCAEWIGAGSSKSEATHTAGRDCAAEPPSRRLVFHRRGALEVSASDPELLAKLIEIAAELGAAGADRPDGLYLGISVPRNDDHGPESHTGLGLVLDLALGRAPGYQSS